MQECKICGNQCKDERGLSVHLKIHKITPKNYYDKFLKKENEEICERKGCSNKTNFLYITKGYNKFCSNYCSNNDKDVKNKRANTCMKKFGVSNPSMSIEVIKKKERNYFKKYGVKNSNEREEVKEKIREKLTSFWKSENGAKMKEVYSIKRKGKKRSKELCKKLKERFKDPEVKENHLKMVNDPDVKRKRSKSMRKAWKDPEVRERYIQGRKNSEKVKAQFKKHREKMLNGLAAYINSFNKSPSRPQLELYSIVKKIYPEAILEYPILNYVIDIVILDKKIAIEYDGSYWHQNKKYDKKRQNDLENLGWRFLRFVDYVPSINEIQEKFKNITMKGLNL